MLIVYHTQSGTAAQLAIAAERGARREDAPVRRRRAVDCGAAETAAARGLLLVCAENSGRLAGGAKDFLDRIFYPLCEAEVVRPYALLGTAGNDGSNAVAEAQRILRGIPFTPALAPKILRGVPDQQALGDAEEFGAAFAAGLAMGIF